MKERNPWILPSVIIALGFIIGIAVFAGAWKSARLADQTITVTGSAKKDIISDLGYLRGTLTVDAPTAQEAYRELLNQRPVLFKYLASKGFPENKVTLFAMNTNPNYQYMREGDGEGRGTQVSRIVSYSTTQLFEISSTNVNQIRDISLDISSLIEQGVNLMNELPEYHYTKLSDLKIAIQAEAAKDAMVRAKKIAEATDRDLGPLRTARMGVLQITPQNSNMVSDYGVNDLSSIEKEITAVVNASFAIE